MGKEPVHDHKLKLKNLSKELPLGYKNIHCPSCHNELPADNLNINDKIGKCHHCNVVFSFQGEIKEMLSLTEPKQEVIRPEGIDLFHFQDELEISIGQPFTPLEAIALSILPTVAFFLTMISIKQGLTFMWAGLFWVISGLLFYILLNRNKHKIFINVDNERLDIQWRPKKMMKDKSFSIGEIDQIYVKKNVSTGGIGLNMIVNGESGQKHVTLIAGLKSFTKARYLEQEIERHLGLKDQKVIEEG